MNSANSISGSWFWKVTRKINPIAIPTTTENGTLLRRLMSLPL